MPLFAAVEFYAIVCLLTEINRPPSKLCLAEIKVGFSTAQLEHIA